MPEYNYTPIKRNKKNDNTLNLIDLLIEGGTKRIGLSSNEFQSIYSTMSKDGQDFYKSEIPYKGAILYKIISSIGKNSVVFKSEF